MFRRDAPVRVSSFLQTSNSRPAIGEYHDRRAALPRIMKRLTPAVQRIILAFTTGLFLACAAQVSGERGGFSTTVESFAP